MMSFSSSVDIYWWSARKHGIGDFENFGDAIGPFIVDHLTGRKSRWVDITRRSWFCCSRVLVTVGSILSNVDNSCDVWGAGLLKIKGKVPNANYYAVRGKYSAAAVKHRLNVDSPIIGDPALLLPRLVAASSSQNCIGIIPHYIHYQSALLAFKNEPDIKIIDLRKSVIEVCKEISSCRLTISSSLHGVIVSHSYGIKSIAVQMNNDLAGDGIKFRDYFSSVGIEEYDLPICQNLSDFRNLISSEALFERLFPSLDLHKITDDLLENFPRKINCTILSE